MPYRAELATGSYAVGFRSYLDRDQDRTYGPAGAPRPVLVALWYPARAGTDAPEMWREDYLHIDFLKDDGGTDEERQFTERLGTYTRDNVSKTVLGKPPGDLDANEYIVLEQFWREPITAIRNATRAEGIFPLIVTHQGFGGTFLDSVDLCEYLASHGYLVAASAYQPDDPASLHVGQDIERSLADMAFLADRLGSAPGTGVIGALGHSYGGQAVLSWAAEPGAPVWAAVSLDTTLEYIPLEEEEVHLSDRIRVNVSLREVRTRFDAACTTFRTPLLIFTQARMNPAYGLYDRLIHSERFYAEVAGVNHLDFGATYALTRSLRSADAAPSDSARAAYEAVCSLTLRFLDTFLRDNATTHQAISADLTGDNGGIVNLRHQPASRH